MISWMVVAVCSVTLAALVSLSSAKGIKSMQFARKLRFGSIVESDEGAIVTPVKFWRNAVRLALFEQEIEDFNAERRAMQFMERRLIVMPLSDGFQSNKADPMFGKIQYGDKCSLPSSLGKQIFEKRYDVPWIFEMKPVRHLHSQFGPTRLIDEGTNIHQPCELFDEALRRKKVCLDTVYISPLDFRSPENYVYLPKWIMRELKLNPFDVVDISMVKIKLAQLVKFQPLSKHWDELLQQGDKSPQALLEHELNKYSTLTAGSTIAISIDGKEYSFHVKETIAEGGVSVRAVRVQDSDIRADIDRSLLDQFIKDDAKKAEEEEKQSTSTVSNATGNRSPKKRKVKTVSKGKTGEASQL